jgi:hypothetical protein
MFRKFKEKLQKHVERMLQNEQTLFITDVDKDKMWEIYLESFLPGTNLIFRERREYDCSCCRQFIKSIGNVVVVEDNKLVSIWDFDADNSIYQPVIDAVSKYVRSVPVCNVFVIKEFKFGVDKNYESMESGVHTYEHFRLELPKRFVSNSSETVGTLMSEFRSVKDVFKRSLETISRESVEILLDLISQNSLYKGLEWKHKLEKFLKVYEEYEELTEDSEKENYYWVKSVEVGWDVGKIRNHVIGTLLLDVTANMDLNEAVLKYGRKVDPLNYQHPKNIYTQKAKDQAKKDIIEMGYKDSLHRRYANINDIGINNIIWANKETLKQMNDVDDIFQRLNSNVINKLRKFDEVEEISIDKFIENVLPRTKNIELYLENKHESNLMSLIAPVVKDSKNMFKWGNSFTWAYNKNVTDSMKEIVKAAGGRVDGPFRYTIQWNDGKFNPNDFDAHCVEPDGNYINYRTKWPKIHDSSARLDVDIINPKRDVVAVENIIITDINRMQEGNYKLYVHCFNNVGGRGGFKAEIEFLDQLYSYEYNKSLRQKEKVLVADFDLSKSSGIKFNKSLDSTTSSKELWNLQSNKFYPVSVCMFSPNYWDKQMGVGNKHYFFMLNGCINSSCPNGFFNEFINGDLIRKNKRVFEALGSEMKVESSEDQLSGLGFSSTKRNSVVVKLEGHMARILKIIF